LPLLGEDELEAGEQLHDLVGREEAVGRIRAAQLPAMDRVIDAARGIAEAAAANGRLRYGFKIIDIA
jgi:hypothetical protein